MGVSDLEMLLDEVLHSDMSLERDDLHQRIAEALPSHLEFYILMTERRRFAVTSNDIATTNLFLPFMSFGFRNGQVRTFDAPRDVADFLDEAELNGEVRWRHPKAIAVTRNKIPKDLQLVRLTEQILLSYYYACGHYEHFMANAGRRFVKDFLREQRSLTTDEVMAAITKNAGCETIYLEYDDAREAPQVRYDPHGVYADLIACPRFRSDLERAVQKKGTFSGKAEGGYNYVVNVAALDRSYEALSDVEHSAPGPTFALSRKRHVLVLCRKDHPIPMDAIKFGPNLFHLHLANDAFSARERLIFEIYRGVADVERRFTAEPPTSKAIIDQLTHERFSQILSAAGDITAAELLIVRTVNPFNNTLEPVAAVANGQAINVDRFPTLLIHSEDTVAESYSQGRGRAITEPDEYVHLHSRTDAADYTGFSFPLRIGALTRGTLECYSSRRAQLQFDEDYLRAIADAIGDAARRIEAAADIAWLSRLSFLHSARHELENFLPLLAERDGELHASLQSTLARYSGVGADPWRKEARGLAAQAAHLFAEAEDSRNEVERFVEQIDTLESVFQPDAAFQFIFSEVLSTLVGNAVKHSSLRASDFRLEFAEQQAESIGLSITYRSSDKRIRPHRAARAATAPIPDTRLATFHYGLFLVAAQVRMNGGAAVTHTGHVVELDTIPFEICFTLPFYPLSSSDAD